MNGNTPNEIYKKKRREKTRAEIAEAREHVIEGMRTAIERERSRCLCFSCAEFVNGFCPYQQSPQQKTCARFRGEK